jgi:hypothetical protein
LRAGRISVKDPAVRTVYLDIAARWRRMAEQQDALDNALGNLGKREK